MLFEVKDLHVRYGAIHALKGISLQVQEKEIVTLIGPNGAGKTTLLRTISGVLKPSAGEILFHDSNGNDLRLHTMPPHQIVARGVAQVPEGRQIFPNLTVRENLELGAYSRKDRYHQGEEFQRIFDLFPRLKERLKQSAGTLSGGEQQMLAIGRALMAAPRLLLLDEPSLGLAPTLVQQIFARLKEINQQGVAILLVEQDAYLALETAHRAYVLETGTIALEGPSQEMLQRPEVKKAYLGG
jgi:branched-chain amino acid transport system ATP-binding protein